MVAGNVAEDRQPDGGWSPGGPSLYSARMAEALGARVTLVTGIPDGYDSRTLAGLGIIAVPATSCPRYENRYLPTGEREQHLYDEGASLDGVEWAGIEAADVLIVAPAFHEFSRPPGLVAAVRAVALQGMLRARQPDNRIRPRRDAISAARQLVRPGDFAFFSDEDTRNPVRLASALARSGATVIVTQAERGATLYAGTWVESFPALPARQVEPTGAGDCFATAFAVRYRESGVLEDSMRLALAAGALAVEGRGVAGIPDRTAIERRLRQVAA